MWITDPNLVGSGRGLLLEEDLGIVETSPMSMIFSGSFVEREKLCTAVSCISFSMLLMLRKPKDLRR